MGLSDNKKKVRSEKSFIAVDAIERAGFEIIDLDDSCIKFEFKGHEVHHFPLKEWSTGKSITDGRGLQFLINQIKKQE